MPDRPPSVPVVPPQIEVAEFDAAYFRGTLIELRDMARMANQPMLAFLLEQALEEVERVDEARRRSH